MKSTRNDLRQLARVRLKEAKALLDAGHYDGAYYPTGLAVECALKACIAKQTQRYDFPDKEVVLKSWQHNLTRLLDPAGLERALHKDTVGDRILSENWSLVKDWQVGDRYELNRYYRAARDLYEAVTARKSGVLKWIRQYW